MRFYITRNHPNAVGQWALCNWATGELVGTFGTEYEAILAIMDTDPYWPSLVAAGDPESFTPWEADPAIVFEGVPTSDRRFIKEGSINFRKLPVPFMLQTITAWGHDGAVIAGRIDTWERRKNGAIWAAGVYDDGEHGVEAARLAANKMLRGVSVDVGFATVELEVLEVDEDGWPIDWLEVYDNVEIMGATQTPFPAFAGAAVKSNGAASGSDETAAESASTKVVAAAGILQPPASWFANPQLDGPTPLTITEEGQVYGHIATWNTCHIGHQNQCVTPPRSVATYSYYATGAVKCDGGCDIPTGVITMGTGHASMEADARAAAAHYDNTGTGFADVAVGEDDHGIWVAGGVRPGITEEQIYAARASSPSGDWRRLGGNLELVAVLLVNVPGFPVARTASGHQTALVAALAPRQTKFQRRQDIGGEGNSFLGANPESVNTRFRMLEQRVDRLVEQQRNENVKRAAELRQRMYGHKIEELERRITGA